MCPVSGVRHEHIKPEHYEQKKGKKMKEYQHRGENLRETLGPADVPAVLHAFEGNLVGARIYVIEYKCQIGSDGSYAENPAACCYQLAGVVPCRACVKNFDVRNSC